MFAPVGCASEGQFWLRETMSKLYKPDFFSGVNHCELTSALQPLPCEQADIGPGDEDNGSMSSWFLLSAMGLYQLVPGNTTYSIGSPLYRSLRIELDNGKQLHIYAPENSPQRPYVKNVSFNGVRLEVLGIDYTLLRQGGVLQFDMSAFP